MIRLLNVVLKMLGIFPNDLSNENPHVKQFHITYKLLIIAMHVAFAILIASFDLLHVNYPQNALTRSGFWIQYVGRLGLVVYMLVMLIKNRELINEVHVEFARLRDNWPKRNGPKYTQKSKVIMVVSLCIGLILTPGMMLYEAINSPMANIYVIWCAYIPGLTIHSYIAYMTFMKFEAAQLSEDLNVYFRRISSRFSWRKQFVHSLQNEIKDDVKLNELHGVFKMHHRLTILINKLHSVYTHEYLLFMIIAMHGIILLSYIVILDLIRVRNSLWFYPRDHLFTEYWAIVAVIDLSFIIMAAHDLNVNESKACPIMHFITSVYYNINEYISVYSFQLLASDVSVSAAGFFEVEYSTFFTILGITLKYVFILLQFDKGATERKCY